MSEDVLDGIDVGLVPNEGLCGFAASDIPELGGGIAGAGDEHILVRTKRQAE
jgi:hypothetical protein